MDRDHRSVAPTCDSSGIRRWIYPDRRRGPFEWKRAWTARLLIAIYLLVPWLDVF